MVMVVYDLTSDAPDLSQTVPRLRAVAQFAELLILHICVSMKKRIVRDAEQHSNANRGTSRSVNVMGL